MSSDSVPFIHKLDVPFGCPEADLFECPLGETLDIRSPNSLLKYLPTGSCHCLSLSEKESFCLSLSFLTTNVSLYMILYWSVQVIPNTVNTQRVLSVDLENYAKTPSVWRLMTGHSESNCNRESVVRARTA
jgi:hypothetical protein